MDIREMYLAHELDAAWMIALWETIHGTLSDDDDRQFHAHQYCFKFKGETYCTELPTLTHLPTAA